MRIAAFLALLAATFLGGLVGASILLLAATFAAGLVALALGTWWDDPRLGGIGLVVVLVILAIALWLSTVLPRIVG
jgi:hypothetical protein